MNKQRRKAIEAVCAKLEELMEVVENIKEEEEAARDNLPESLLFSTKGEAMDEAINSLDAAVDYIQECIESLEEAKA